VLSQDQLRTVSELRGFLNAFECVNNRDDQGYMFEIWGVRKKPDLDLAVEEVFARWNASRVSKTRVSEWEKSLSSVLERWLLAFLKDSHHLIDRGKHFTLSSDSGRKKLSKHFLQKLTSISNVVEAYTLHIESEELSTHAHDDILLVCDEVLLFLHFEACE
jgi:hypothetical protein